MSDLAKLFETDPLNLTATDIDTIILKMRSVRTQFELGLKPTPVGERKTKKSQGPDISGLDLGEIGDLLK